MSHPVFRNYKSRIFYAGLWIFIIVVQALVTVLTAGLSPWYAFLDSLAFNFIFSSIILLFWYPLSYNSWKGKKRLHSLLMHIILCIMLLVLWLASGYAVMYLLLGNDVEYVSFLSVSILWKIAEGILFYAVAILVYYMYMYVERLNEKANREIYLNKLVKDSELNLLKSQINPHFLFNGLNSVQALIIQDPLRAREMLLALSDYLRFTVSSTQKEMSDLREEMENIERYLSIEKLRFGEKLVYELDMEPECLSLKIPSMLLQPLFENAVKHGVYESTENVRISVRIGKAGDHLLFEISNDFDPENPGWKKGSGTGLKNTAERLKLFYGALASFRTQAENGRFIVTLMIPCN